MKSLLDSTQLRPVTVLGPSGPGVQGQACVQEHSGREAFTRGGRRALKIVAISMGCLLPFAFMEPFLFLVWGSIAGVLLLGFLGPYFHLKYWDERVSFEYVEAACPSCGAGGPLRPYVSTKFEAVFTVLCPACGQTARVEAR